MTAWWALATGGALAAWPAGRSAAATRWSVLLERRRLVPAGALSARGGAGAERSRDGRNAAGYGRWFTSARVVSWAGIVLILSIAALTVGAALTVAVAAACTATIAPLRDATARRRRRTYRRDLLTAIEVLQGELGAGTPVPQALVQARARAASAADAFSLAAGEQLEAGEAPSLRDAKRRASPSPAAAGLDADRTALHRALRAGAAVTMSTGAGWSAVVDGIAADLTAHDARDDALQAALAGTRASMLLLAGLPVLGVMLAAGLGAHPLHFLLGSGAGRLVLAASAILQAVGILVVLGLMRRASR